jgi:serine/threonine protein kinase
MNFAVDEIAGSSHLTKQLELPYAADLAEVALYISPEQCQADQLTAHSDIYALGCIMYEVLAGHAPFRSKNPVKVMIKHMSATPPKLHHRTSIAADLVRVIERCLEKQPERRYITADALLADLEKIQDDRPIKKRAPGLLFGRCGIGIWDSRTGP